MKLLALMKKEFLRFFRDPRLILSMLLPGLLIYVIYSVMGSVLVKESASYAFRVAVAGMDGASAAVEAVDAAVTANEGWTAEFISAEEAGGEEAAREAVRSGELTALLVFPAGFEEALGDADAPKAGAELVCNSSNGASAAFGTLAGAALREYASRFSLTLSDYAAAGNTAAKTMAGILPFLIVVFVYTACMSVTLESVAGEKERGTLSTVLVTSVRRRDIALGKVLPLACVSLIGAASSFLGTALSIPRLMGVSIGAAVSGVGFTGYLMMFLLIVSFVPLIVGVIAAVSTFARSVREASAYTGVLMLLMMVLSILTAFLGSIGGWVTAVPVLNAVSAMQGIFMGKTVLWQCLVSFAANLVYAALLVLLIAKMLSSERIMFGK